MKIFWFLCNRNLKTFRFSSSCGRMATFESLKFDNVALKELPIDKEERNYVRTVRWACFSRVLPTPLENPSVIASSSSALQLLDFSENEIYQKEFVEYFSGNKLLPGSEPAAHCYCGHQFGRFAGQLGDGAAIYLGEIINKKFQRWEIQLKGAGSTPYSRFADGRKVLRSSIREFLCSEAMHFLGIPTTRAGTCITSDTEVMRDIFYNGNAEPEKCTVVLRIAPTFIRFGSFEIFKERDSITGNVGPSVGRTDILHTLLNYVIDTFFPEVSSCVDQIEKYSSFFKEVVIRTAKLVALWQSVGFCHGVLNTDNMSIVGITIDYGPFGFLDMYNPDHICNASDVHGRYRFKEQPHICHWNLSKLAEAIKKALPLESSAPLLKLYYPEFQSTFLMKMQDKLGLVMKRNFNDKIFIEKLLEVMEETGSDFTNTFLCFSLIDVNAIEKSFEILHKCLLEQCYSLQQVFIGTFGNNPMTDEDLEHFQSDISASPFIEIFSPQHQSSLRKIQRFKSLKNMTEAQKHERDKILWKDWLQMYCDRIKLDIKTYNGDIEVYRSERILALENSNPKFILRNYILEEAIKKAEKGDPSKVRQLLEVVKKPYEYPDPSVYDKHMEENKESCTESASSCQTFYKAPNSSFSIKVT